MPRRPRRSQNRSRPTRREVERELESGDAPDVTPEEAYAALVKLASGDDLGVEARRRWEAADEETRDAVAPGVDGGEVI